MHRREEIRCIDCFSFNNEIDLLEFRLKTIGKFFDAIVISESRLTHSGLTKPLYAREFFDSDRAKSLSPEITHKVRLLEVPLTSAQSNWERERAQRDLMLKTIQSEGTDAYIHCSDADEIPHPHFLSLTLKNLLVDERDIRLLFIPYTTSLSFFKLNYVNLLGPESEWRAPFFCHSQNIGSLSALRRAAQSTKIDQIDKKCRYVGWHFSYIGDQRFVKDKLKSFAHQEDSVQYAFDDIERFIASRTGPFDFRGSYHWEVVPLEFLQLPVSVIDTPFVKKNSMGTDIGFFDVIRNLKSQSSNQLYSDNRKALSRLRNFFR